MARKNNPIILIADDDEDDFLISKKAFTEVHPHADIHNVKNGEELLDYLKHEARPTLILMDLNMPRKDGREALKEIKNDRDLGMIPIIIMTTSTHPSDILFCYQNGANSVILKPTGYSELRRTFENICKYWLQTVQLPDTQGR